MGLLAAGVALARPALQEPPPAAAESVEPWAQPAPEIAAVELVLPPGSKDANGLTELVTVRRGQLLSALAVRRSVENLWNTGRFTNVEARTVEVEGGVRLVFALTPVQKLVRLVIEGNVALSDEELRQVSGLQEEAPLDDDSVDVALAAIEEAYSRKGYDQARVEVSEEPAPGGVVLVLTMDEGEPTRLGRMTLTGSPGLPLPRLLEALGLKPGAVFDHARLDAGLERLRALLREEHYYRARVGAPTVKLEAGRATVALPVSAGPRYSFHFHGNHQFPEVLLERVLAYDGTEPLDPGVMWNLARRLANFYRYRGFHDVRVTPREVRRPDHAEAVLVFEIEEGHALTVTEVRFQGNVALPSGVLREVLAERIRASEPLQDVTLPLRDDPLQHDGDDERGPRAVPLAPDPHTVFVEEAYLEAAEVLTEAYRERGFPNAQVRFHRLELDVSGRTAVAEFKVEEGSEARVGEVAYDPLPPGVSVRELGLGKKDSLSEETVERARQNLERALAREGYLFARVEVTAEPGGGEDPRDMKVHLKVEPGPQVRVGAIIVQGLKRTDEKTVRSILDLEPGKTLDLEKLAEGRRRLARLNIFRQVEVQVREPNSREELKDILVTVEERPRIDGEVSGGYFLVDGPRVTLDTAFPNVDGRGLNLLARAKVNYVGWSAEAFSGRYAGVQDSTIRGWEGLGGRGSVSLTQPRLNFFLLPRDTGARVDLIGERVHRPSYLSTRFAAVAGLDWAATRWLNLSLQYELEHNRLRSRGGVLSVPSRADQERLRFPYGAFTLHSLRPSFTMDFRDDPTNPREGLLISSSAEFTRDLGVAPTDAAGNPAPDFPINELKLSGSVSVYAPLGRRASLALSARAGTIVPLAEGAQSIGSKLFYLGGSSSLRGFREDGVLPEDQRAEVRQQIRDCRSVINPAGCPAELQGVLAGQAPISQGGEVFTLGKAELRLPATTSLDLGVFFEAGNLWEDRTNFEPMRLRYTAGVGLRYVTPVGPLAFDVGFNLDRDEVFNEPATQFHFSIGVF